MGTDVEYGLVVVEMNRSVNNSVMGGMRQFAHRPWGLYLPKKKFRGTKMWKEWEVDSNAIAKRLSDVRHSVCAEVDRECRLRLKVPVSELRGRDVMVGYVVSREFSAELHVDHDAIPTAVGVVDVGLCDDCHFQQELCFPTLGGSVPLVDKGVTVFDPCIPHCASFIKKSNPACDKCVEAARYSMVIECGSRYVSRKG
eukprot:scaffold325745_cov17-Prasinocladus_malaysianus.AAC.2